MSKAAMEQQLFTPINVGSIPLKNRIVMAPMTRSRASETNIPNRLMAEYYAQRAGAGLIITEGTSPSPNGVGYARIPGIWSASQVAEWKTVTDAVHAKGGRIVVQLMHTGRVGHPLNLPPGAEVLAPAAKLKCEARLFTIPLPITGWLAWLIGLNVPIGLGAELEESLSLDSVGVDVAADLRTSLDVGVSCPEAAAGFEPVHAVTATATRARGDIT